MEGSTNDPVAPTKPTTVLASICSVLLLLRRHHALPSSSSSSSTPSLVTILDRSLGAAVTLGLSLAILKWVAANHSNSDGANTNNSKRTLTEDNHKDGETSLNSISGLPPWLEEFRWILPSAYFPSTNNGSDDEDLTTTEDDNEIAIHRGSCHCKSIIFQWEAPRSCRVRDGPGKIRYRHTQIAASSFRLLAGSDCLQTYYVVAPSSTPATSVDNVGQPPGSAGNSVNGSSRVLSWDQNVDSFMHNKTREGDNRKVGAHSFCRRCGVHILYAPSSHSSKLEINVDCSEDDPTMKEYSRVGKGRHSQSRVKLESFVEDQGLSSGIALPGQWQQAPQYPPRPPELKGALMRHQLFKAQNGETGSTAASTARSTGLTSEPTLSKAAVLSDLPRRWESPIESKPQMSKLQSPDTPSTLATSCDGLSVPTSSQHGQSVGGDASSSFAEDMLSSTSSSSECDGDESTHNDVITNLVWTEDEQHNHHTTNPSPMSHHSNHSTDVTASISSLTSSTSTTIANPMLRDQLKYYMSKHIEKPKDGTKK